MVLALACRHNLEIEQMDVVTPFLNADVVSQVFMDQPEGYKVLSNDGARLVYHLRKTLYVIREAPSKGVECSIHLFARVLWI